MSAARRTICTSADKNVSLTYDTDFDRTSLRDARSAAMCRYGAIQRATNSEKRHIPELIRIKKR